MAILGCVLLHLPDESPAASTSGSCGIGRGSSAPRNEGLRDLTMGLLGVSSTEALLSPFRRIATTRLPRYAPGTNRLLRAARASSEIDEAATIGRRSSMPTRGLKRVCEGAGGPTSRHAALQPGSHTPRHGAEPRPFSWSHARASVAGPLEPPRRPRLPASHGARGASVSRLRCTRRRVTRRLATPATAHRGSDYAAMSRSKPGLPADFRALRPRTRFSLARKADRTTEPLTIVVGDPLPDDAELRFGVSRW